jgi:uncharacterized protein
MEWQKLVQEKMSRRNFMRGLAALGASTAVRTAVPAAALGAIVGAAASARAQEMGLPFTPIEPSSQDDIVLPEGFSYQVIIKRGDVFTKDGKAFGENADWTGWYPIDMLTGGNSTEEGLLLLTTNI